MKMNNNNEWKKVCAACAEGTPPARCAYYGDPDGCNAPTLGKHPEGDLAERLQEELEKAERRIAELERAFSNAAAMRRTLEEVEGAIFEDEPGRFWLADAEEILHRVQATLATPPEPPSDADKMREAILAIKEINDRRPHDAAGYEINDIIEEALAGNTEKKKEVVNE